MTKKVLWLSRHVADDLQKDVLREKLGDIELIQVAQQVQSAQEVVDLMHQHECKEMVVVLPPAILADLTNPRISPVKPIRAVMKRVPNGTTNEKGEEQFDFEFSHYERVEKIEVVTTPL